MSSISIFEPFYSASDFDRLFDEAFKQRSGGGQTQRRIDTGVMSPRMDIHENAEANQVTATFELPGLKKEDVHIDYHNGRLTIGGETKSVSESDSRGYAVRERRYGKFRRTLQLPEGIKDNEIKAGMENGVLTVTFPKSAPELAPKKITIG
jgi:HSP20 family protein